MGKLSMKPVCNILVIIFCFCGLAIHFAADSVNTANPCGYLELSKDGGQSLDTFEDSEDDLVLSKHNNTSPLILLFSTSLKVTVYSILPTFLPQLPPPKFNPTA
jgi:hypothetical protein